MVGEREKLSAREGEGETQRGGEKRRTLAKEARRGERVERTRGEGNSRRARLRRSLSAGAVAGPSCPVPSFLCSLFSDPVRQPTTVPLERSSFLPSLNLLCVCVRVCVCVSRSLCSLAVAPTSPRSTTSPSFLLRLGWSFHFARVSRPFSLIDALLSYPVSYQSRCDAYTGNESRVVIVVPVTRVFVTLFEFLSKVLSVDGSLFDEVIRSEYFAVYLVPPLYYDLHSVRATSPIGKRISTNRGRRTPCRAAVGRITGRRGGSHAARASFPRGSQDRPASLSFHSTAFWSPLLR